jgi:hypothetical protein
MKAKLETPWVAMLQQYRTGVKAEHMRMTRAYEQGKLDAAEAAKQQQARDRLLQNYGVQVTYDQAPAARRPAVPHYANPTRNPRVPVIDPLQSARDALVAGAPPPPLPPSPTEFELLTAARRAKHQQDSPLRRSTSRSPPPSQRNHHHGHGAPDDFNAARYVAGRLATLRSDKNEFEQFRGTMKEAEIQYREERRTKAEASRPHLEGARVPCDRADVVAREAARVDRAKELHAHVIRDTVNRRREIVELDEQRQTRSEAVREYVQGYKLRCKMWLTAAVLARSVMAMRGAKLNGYRRRWVRLLTVYIARHWRRRAARRRETFLTLKLNWFIRRNLPNMVEAFRLRRAVAAAPLLRTFLRQYNNSVKFAVTLKNFNKHVKQVQQVVRRRRMARSITFYALQMAWAREENALVNAETPQTVDGRVMLTADQAIVDVHRQRADYGYAITPDKVRNLLLLELYRQDGAHYRTARAKINEEWAALRRHHAPSLRGRQRLRLTAIQQQQNINPSADPVQYDGQDTAFFIDRMFSGARTFFESSPQETPLRPAALATGAGGASESRGADGAAPSRAFEASARLLAMADQASQLKRHGFDRRRRLTDARGGNDQEDDDDGDSAAAVDSHGGSPKPSHLEGAAVTLHPAMRFGARKNIVPRNIATPLGAVLPRTSSRIDGSPQNRNLAHQAVVAGKSKLQRQQQQQREHAQPGAAVSVHANRDGASSNSTTQPARAAAASPGGASLAPPPAHYLSRNAVALVGKQVIEIDRLLRPPPMPPRKAFARRGVMRRFVLRAREAVVTAIQQTPRTTTSTAQEDSSTYPYGTGGAAAAALRSNGAALFFDRADVAQRIDASWTAGFAQHVQPAYHDWIPRDPRGLDLTALRHMESSPLLRAAPVVTHAAASSASSGGGLGTHHRSFHRSGAKRATSFARTRAAD